MFSFWLVRESFSLPPFVNSFSAREGNNNQKSRRENQEENREWNKKKNMVKSSASQENDFSSFSSWKFMWVVVSYFNPKLLIMLKLLGYAYVMRLEAEFKCDRDCLSLYKQEKYYCFDNSRFQIFAPVLARPKKTWWG